MSKILKVNPLNIDPKLIEEAARIIRGGGLVAFPTETVYGLGADALNGEAVSKVFEAKKRPLDNPLIIHIADKKDLAGLVENVPAEAEKLIDRFWLGPLTLIFKKTQKVPDLVTSGLDMVAVRMPSNMIAMKLIAAAGVPMAVPSANLFGRPSPTMAQHVIDDLGDAVDMILDGGKTEIGVESTVVELADGGIVILRPGGISVEELKSVVKKVQVREKPSWQYSLRARVIIVENDSKQIESVSSIAKDYIGQGNKVGIMSKEEHSHAYREFNNKAFGPESNLRICASKLFNVLREFDAENIDIIIAEAIPERGLGLAIMSRLKKAAAF